MSDHAVGLAGVEHFENRAAFGLDHAAIADLPAAFGIKGRLCCNDSDAIARIAAAGDNLRLSVVAAMADESRRGARAELELGRDRVVLARAAATLALLVHQALELSDVDVDSVVAENILRQIERETISVVELERDVTGEHFLAGLAQPGTFCRQQIEAVIERLTETCGLRDGDLTNP